MELVNNTQLQLAFDFVQYTGTNIFLTGKAGTGKTTFLHSLKKKSPKRMIVVAPTGVAAINAGGVTIHSFFQMPFGPYIPVDFAKNNSSQEENKIAPRHNQKFNREKIGIFKGLDLLVIDEISMVRADLLDGIDEVLRRYKDRYKPFGGVQLLMIGDLQQLAPVAKDDEWNILKDYYETVFFFSSKALQKTKHITIELKHIYRQSDSVFIDMLNKVRDNNVDEKTLSDLNKRYIPGFDPGAKEGYITLTTHNSQSKEINESKLKKLPAKAHSFNANIKGDFPEYAYPTDFELILKTGAQVMFVKNDSSQEKQYYNGKIGTIDSFDEDIIYVKCPDESDCIQVYTAEWQNTKYSLDEKTKEIKETVAGTFVQYPLKLAWAITIHKSQGLTFEKAIIDANAAFAHGQVYVALSRCKTFEGLVLSTPIANHSIKLDANISVFSREAEQNPPGGILLTELKQDYQQKLLLELFDFNLLLRRLAYLIKIANENKTILNTDLPIIFEQINGLFKTEIAEVADKFKSQIKYLLVQETNVEENAVLQDRIKKACTYFAEKTDTVLCQKLSNVTIETDNKAVRKSIKETLGHLCEESAMKLSCLKFCQAGFNVKEYLESRAIAAIESPEEKHVSKPDEGSTSFSVAHPKLYASLKAWRNEKADELELPAYIISNQKSLMELANNLPATEADLKNIKGFGKKKTERWGKELLEIIAAYCKENNLVPVSNIVRKDKPLKSEKTGTIKISYDLFKTGETIGEIATRREMAASTIEGHLAHYICTGELKVEQFVAPEKIALILDYFQKNESTLLGPAKAELGDKVTYGDLRFVLKHLQISRMNGK
jgi:GTPase SAR1 family protein